MAYQIQIAVGTESGRTYIGAAAVHNSTESVETDKVYGSQLGYRVVARDEDGRYHLCTRTDARACGWTVTSDTPFPQRW